MCNKSDGVLFMSTSNQDQPLDCRILIEGLIAETITVCVKTKNDIVCTRYKSNKFCTLTKL